MFIRCLVFTCFLVFTFQINAQTVEPRDSIISWLNKAIQDKNKEQECNFTYKLASSYVFGGETEKAIEYTQKAVELAAQTEQHTIMVNALNLYARTLRQEGELDQAIEKYAEATGLAKQFGDTLLYANSLENLGIAYSSAGKTNYPKALECYLEAARLKENKQAWSQLAGCYKRLSSLYREIGNETSRETYLLKAVELVDTRSDINQSFKAAIYNEAGCFYTDEKVDYQNAIMYLDKVLKISQKLGWKKGIAVSLSNKANIFIKKENYSKALELQKEALQLKVEIHDSYGMVNSNKEIGLIYLKQKKYTKSIESYKKAEELANKANLTNELKEVFLGLYKAHKAQNQFSLSLQNYEQYTLLSDSIKGESHKKVLAELETKYETEKKEQQIEQLTTEKQIETLKASQRKLVAILLFALLLISSVLFIFINRQNQLKRKRNESELNQRLLRSQMNPHFIFNALGSIQNYIYLNEPDEAAKYLTSFSKLMRDILESSVSETIPLEQELSIVKNYLILQKIRKEDIFNFEIINNCSQDIQVPPMLAQPFIENSVKHAFKGIDYFGGISVKYSSNETHLIILVEDNGIGYNNNKFSESNHKSMAVDLTQKRLNLFKYKNIHSSLLISDRSIENRKGTKVEINIPLEKCLKF